MDTLGSMFWDNWFGVERVIVMTLCAYVGLIIILRMVGKRSLAKLNAFDFVVTVALGSTLASILLSKDIAFAEGMMAFVMLCGLQWIVSKLSVRRDGFKKLIRSDPRLILENGEFLHQALHDERVTHSEVMSEIRKHGFADLEDIAAVVLESDGTFSVIAHSKATTRSALDDVRNTADENGK
ncbi:DUF421 domain-containing protein [Croceicoccus sp. F390]|uniref:DUF421 domain-containing protein n=1 Tax=Croceicoccus esteveae TaxID=3075597 RepID=A0ABU2ZF48_9SPHN|nr:YetF domain-containing protein [Croceicoccus sp. F390]MDT0575214.1 DUF421 domain-containing protein [Croceicoccus sp. F390]